VGVKQASLNTKQISRLVRFRRLLNASGRER